MVLVQVFEHHVCSLQNKNNLVTTFMSFSLTLVLMDGKIPKGKMFFTGHRRRTRRGRGGALALLFRKWGGGGGSALPPPHFFADGIFLHANARYSKPKVASRCRHAANIAFDLFNISLYVIARKVRKCPLSPFVTSNVFFVVSCANGRHFGATCTKGRQPVCFTINWRTLVLFVKHTTPPHSSLPQLPPPPPPPPLFGPLRRPCWLCTVAQ